MLPIFDSLSVSAPTISDGSDGKLHVQVAGNPADTIRWTATIETAEVAF